MRSLIQSFLILLSVHFCYGQNDTIFSEKRTDSFSFIYSQKPADKEKNSNLIIEELSRIIPKSIQSTQYTFTFDCRISIINTGKTAKDGEKKFLVSAGLSNGKCTGDILYRSFSIAGFLIPDYFDFTVSLENSSHNVLKPIQFDSLILHSGKGKIENIEFRDAGADSVIKSKINNKLFYYNDTSFKALIKRVKLIDDYYESENTISSALEKLNGIKLENAELIKVYEISLKEVEAVITAIGNKNFTSELGLSVNDPLSFASKYNNLSQKAKNIRLLINQKLNAFDKVLYEKGIEYLDKADTTEALKHFEKSTIVNPLYSPAFYQLAMIYFSKKQLDKAYPNITTITTKLSSDKAYFDQAVKLGQKIYETYLTKAEAMINAETYYDALDLLASAKSFCSSTPSIPCSSALQTDIAKARYGIYNSFIVVSQKAIDKQILDIGEIYIIKAKEYQQKNSSDILSSKEADNLLNQLVEGLTNRGFKYNLQQKYDSAFLSLEKAYELCNTYPEIKCREKITSELVKAKKGTFRLMISKAGQLIRNNETEKADSLITVTLAYQKDNINDLPGTRSIDSLKILLKEKWYEKYITDGINCLKINDGIKALEYFETAKKIETNFTVKKNRSLDSLTMASIKPIILNFIEKACVKTWGNEPEKAKTLEDSAKALQKKYTLSSDTIINNAIADLNTKLFNQRCRNAQENYNENYRKAFTLISQKKYNEADDYLAKCIKTSKDNQDCNIQDSLAKLNKEKYLYAAIYQKKVKESEQLAASTKYYDAINKYMEAEKYYNEHNMVSSGIIHLKLKDYLTSQNDKKYLYGCANYYLDRDDYLTSLYYVEMLRIKGYADVYTAGLQETLANSLAPIDFAANSKQRPNSLINKYTNGYSWYDCFKKAYQAKWKELRKKKK